MDRPPARPSLTGILAVTLAAALSLAGCTAEVPELGQPADSGSSLTDDTIVEIAPADRAEPISFAGSLDTGGEADSGQWLGNVVVVNFWDAACPPGRVEAPDLEAVHQQFTAAGVVFIGVNVRDSAPTASSFATEFGVTYPSILDAGGGAVQFAFSGKIAPNAVPTTLVLDRDGRVAARVIGRLPSQTTLASLLETVLAEGER